MRKNENLRKTVEPERKMAIDAVVDTPEAEPFEDSDVYGKDFRGDGHGKYIRGDIEPEIQK